MKYALCFLAFSTYALLHTVNLTTRFVVKSNNGFGMDML